MRRRAEEGLPDGCRRPGERNPRDANWTTDPLAPFVKLCCVRVSRCPEPFESITEMFQFSALTNAPHERVPVNGDGGFQQANGRLGQQRDGLLSGRKQPLEFGDGGLSGVALDPEGLVAPPRFDGRVCRIFFHCVWKRMGSEGTVFYFGLDERTPFDGEGLPGDLDRALEVPIGVLGFEKTLPEEAVALSSMLACVPSAQLVEGGVRILRDPVDQGPCRPEGLCELLPDQHDVGDGRPGRT